MKLAIVTPWFGDACESGPAAHARRLARAFAASGHDVEVLATASRAPGTPWDRNDLPLGLSRDEGYAVRRFAVDRRDAQAFAKAEDFLRIATPRSARSVLPPAVVEGYAQNVRSSALLEFLHGARAERDAFVFMPYRWQPVLEGVPIVAERAFLQPCLQREAYAFLPAVAGAVHAARGLFFGSEAEYRLALHVFGPGIREKSTIVGDWLDERDLTSPAPRPGAFPAERERFALYLGRRDETRNVGLLVEAFRAFRERRPATSLKLVLAGPGAESYAEPESGIADLGPLLPGDRAALLGFAQALVEPSYDAEGSSVLEACARRCPVAVNADGPWPASFSNTRSGLSAGDAGWEAATKAEWTRVFEAIDLGEASDRERRGNAVRRYFERDASPAAAIARYEAAFADLAPREGTPVYHMVASGDLTDDAVRRGFAFADFSGYAGTAAAVRTGVEALAGDEVVVHSPKAEHLRAALLGAPLVGAIVYDTAAFAGSEREAFEVATAAAAGAGTSERAVAFLRDAGLRSAQELPFVSATRCWDVPSDAGLARLLDDGAANCVYAGQLDANAGIDRLLAAFAFLLALEVDARLIMCVPLEPVTDVLRDFRSTVADSGLAGRVLEISSSDPGRLAAAYRAATIFWTLSVTATSLVPLVDAMWFDVPVLAYASAPCAALLGPAGLLVRDAADPGQIAGLAKILIGDAKLRETVLSMQQRRREALTYDRAAGARCARDYLGPAVLERSPA